jgi:hypothetical protein
MSQWQVLAQGRVKGRTVVLTDGRRGVVVRVTPGGAVVRVSDGTTRLSVRPDDIESWED